MMTSRCRPRGRDRRSQSTENIGPSGNWAGSESEYNIKSSLVSDQGLPAHLTLHRQQFAGASAVLCPLASAAAAAEDGSGRHRRATCRPYSPSSSSPVPSLASGSAVLCPVASAAAAAVGAIDARRSAPTRLLPRSQDGGRPLARIGLRRPLPARIRTLDGCVEQRQPRPAMYSGCQS